MRRVVITGIGTINPSGNNSVDSMNGLLEGKRFVSTLKNYDVGPFQDYPAAEVNLSHDHKTKRGIKFSEIAIEEAIKDSELKINTDNNISIFVGINFQEADSLISLTKNFSSDLVNENRCSLVVEELSRKFNFLGRKMCVSAACASGNYAVSIGYDSVKYNESDIAIVGAETAQSIFAFSCFNKLNILSKGYCRPFDKNRDGLIPSEGAAFLVLEDLDHAIKRNAKIYAEVLGYGMSCDAYHPVAGHPQGEGVIRAIKKALTNSKIKNYEIDYISAHGTGTQGNDITEVLALRSVFNDYLDNIPVSSIKSMIGHSFAASSAIEAVICCKVIELNKIPPTINYQTPDPDCNIDCVSNMAREKKVNVVMNNSFGFGGYNCVTVFKRFIKDE